MRAEQIEVARVRTQSVPGIGSNRPLRVGSVHQVKSGHHGSALLFGQAAANIPEQGIIAAQEISHLLTQAVGTRGSRFGGPGRQSGHEPKAQSRCLLDQGGRSRRI